MSVLLSFDLYGRLIMIHRSLLIYHYCIITSLVYATFICHFLFRCHSFILLFYVPSSLFLVALAVSGSTQLKQKESPSKRPGPARTIFWDCFPAAYNLQKYHLNCVWVCVCGLFFYHLSKHISQLVVFLLIDHCDIVSFNRNHWFIILIPFFSANERTNGVWVDAGWFQQPHLARVRLIGLWGWVRLHTCCALTHHGTQVKPAISTHTGRALTCRVRWCGSEQPSPPTLHTHSAVVPWRSLALATLMGRLGTYL